MLGMAERMIILKTTIEPVNPAASESHSPRRSTGSRFASACLRRTRAFFSPRSRQTRSLAGADPRSDFPRCGGRKSDFLAAMGFLRVTGRRDRKPLWGVSGRHVLLVWAMAATGCGPATESPKLQGTPGEWLEFAGSWNAAGSRRTISLGADRRGSILDLRGTMLLTGPKRPGVGFRSEVIALVDSETGLMGRSVWTDERGEQIFSELQGEGTAARLR